MPSKLTFLVRSHRQELPAKPRPVFALTTDNWDDFGHKVQFHLAYVDADGVETRIGALKILSRSQSQSNPDEVLHRTALPESFSELDERFISLGQEDDYYKLLFSLVGQEAGTVLDALRDVAWQPSLAIPFEPTTAFRNALMRENTAHRARRFGRAWTLGEPTEESPAFSYSCHLEGVDVPIDMTFPFDGTDLIPGRVVGIIGRNAVGKTRFLGQLAEDLAQTARASAERITERETRFPGTRPLFTRVIAVSYSAFDRFKRPPPRSASSYVYCGIRNDRGTFSPASLRETYLKNHTRVRQLDRHYEWSTYIARMLGVDGTTFSTTVQGESDSSNADEDALSLLSSGQAILCHFTTALLAWMEHNTLVLFDEPETHLHPNAVANLFAILSDILSTYDSYAVIATHSPLVIQELPAKRVRVFRREGNATRADPLLLESFGESVNELTRHVFETIEIDSGYRQTLRKLAADESPREVLRRFPMGLSLCAQAYLLGRRNRRP